MREARYARKGHEIITLETGNAQGYPSINEAKRESRRLQMELDHKLGLGSVRTIPTKSKGPNKPKIAKGRKARRH